MFWPYQSDVSSSWVLIRKGVVLCGKNNKNLQNAECPTIKNPTFFHQHIMNHSICCLIQIYETSSPIICHCSSISVSQNRPKSQKKTTTESRILGEKRSGMPQQWWLGDGWMNRGDGWMTVVLGKMQLWCWWSFFFFPAHNTLYAPSWWP